MENKSKGFGIGGYKGRIIFLGDGTEVLTDSDDTEMFDNSEEDKDLASQVSKNSEDVQLPPRAPSPPPRTPKKQDTKSQAKTDESTPKNSITTAEAVAEAFKDEPKEAKTEAAAASKD